MIFSAKRPQIVPITTPTKTSDKKCTCKYNLEKATKTATTYMGIRIFLKFLLMTNLETSVLAVNSRVQIYYNILEKTKTVYT